MKKLPHNQRKKTLLDFEEHKELARDLRAAQEILEPWMDRFYKAYSVNGKEVAQLRNVLNLLSSKICCIQDDHWYKLNVHNLKENDTNTGNNSPYYGSGKIAWT